MTPETQAIATLFAQAWREHRQIDCPVGVRSADDAYRIQDTVFAARFPGQRASAWKAGASGPAAEPTAAPIGSVLASPALVAANAFHMFGIEGEVAFRLEHDLPARAEGWSTEELTQAVDELVVTIEICDTRLTDWKAASALSRLADFQLNGALVTGSGTRDWQAVDFGTQHAELWINGKRDIDNVGTHPLGGPFGILPWAVEHCARRAGGLRRGDLVTTGSWTGMRFVAPGDTVLVRFPGIGEASVRIG